MKRPFIASLCCALAATCCLSACSSRPAVKGVRAVKTAVESTITTTSTGTVTAQQSAVLSFGATGRVLRVQVKVGDRVARGQLLANLENSDLRTVFGDAERELERAQELFQAGLVSRAALDEARKAVEIARANLDKTVIRAPFAGVVTEVNLEMGELAQFTSSGNAAPIRLVDLKPRLVKGDVDEIDLAKVKVGTPARVKIAAVRPEPFAAVVQRVVPFVSTIKEQDRTSEIELRLVDAAEAGQDAPPERIPPGASADIEIVTEQKKDVIAVPSRTILGQSGSRYVFQFTGDRLRKTPVRLGIGNYARTEIIEGVREGDTLIYPPEDIDLKDGMKVKVETAPWP